MKEKTLKYLPYFLLPLLLVLLLFWKELFETLQQIYLTHSLHILDKTSTSLLMLGNEQRTILQSGGTWYELFSANTLQNRSQLLAVIFWWTFCTILGWAVYPIVRILFSGLSDHGFPLSRITAFLLFSYSAWIAGSTGIRVTRLLLGIILLIILVISLLIFIKNKKAIITEFSENKTYFIKVELIALVAFLLFLYVRFNNPDLWHIYFGGEKPMDFSYFNAVLKSEIFPPYDPWFAGGQMNYYYLGLVIIGMPVKFLGITPSVAYNLVIPTLFSFVVLGAFTIGWNLTKHNKWLSGVFSSLTLAILGNLGAVRMVWQGWQRISTISTPLFNHFKTLNNILYALSGAGNWLLGNKFPYSSGDWYWLPSRAIVPGHSGEITEFPLFTFVYADLHAHLLALPITLFVIAWSLSIINTNFIKEKNGHLLAKLTIGSLIVGSLRAINAWDQPTFLLFSSLSLLYVFITNRKEMLSNQQLSYFQIFIYTIYFVGMSFLLYVPFYLTFQQGYSEIMLWKGDKVNLSSYTVHFGLFIFILCVYLFYKVFHWMSKTPVSALRKLKPYRWHFEIGMIFIGLLFSLLLFDGLKIIVLVMPLLLICAFLFFQNGENPQTRFLLYLAGTGLLITVFVDIATIQGDRMNTTFKFYFQAWTFLSISAGVALANVLRHTRKWKTVYKRSFYSILLVLVAGCSLTTITSTKNKMEDRFTNQAPHSLDGMIYMSYSTMMDGPPVGNFENMDLAEDARAIRWVQHNIPGSPVIVEAHTQEYRHWGNRFSIYTGLPGVIGWANHQRQQRAVMDEDPVGKRIQEVEHFYQTDNLDEAITFLDTYDVSYIIVGQLERIYYSESGLVKFTNNEGILWDLIYVDNETEIFKIRK